MMPYPYEEIDALLDRLESLARRIGKNDGPATIMIAAQGDAFSTRTNLDSHTVCRLLLAATVTALQRAAERPDTVCEWEGVYLTESLERLQEEWTEHRADDLRKRKQHKTKGMH